MVITESGFEYVKCAFIDLPTEGDLSTTVENRLCNAYMALGARGVSILFSSGDGGVSGSQRKIFSRMFLYIDGLSSQRNHAAHLCRPSLRDVPSSLPLVLRVVSPRLRLTSALVSSFSLSNY